MTNLFLFVSDAVNNHILLFDFYADDTYLVIPASNVETRAAELDHVEQSRRPQSITSG